MLPFWQVYDQLVPLPFWHSSRVQCACFGYANVVNPALRLSTRVFARSLVSCMRLETLRETKKKQAPLIDRPNLGFTTKCVRKYRGSSSRCFIRSWNSESALVSELLPLTYHTYSRNLLQGTGWGDSYVRRHRASSEIFWFSPGQGAFSLWRFVLQWAALASCWVISNLLDIRRSLMTLTSIV